MIDVPEVAFTNLGFNNVLDGAEIFEALQIDPKKMVFPHQMADMKEIAQFVNDYPEAISMLRGAMMKKPFEVEALVHAKRYLSLHKQRIELKDQLKSLEDQITLYE